LPLAGRQRTPSNIATEPAPGVEDRKCSDGNAQCNTLGDTSFAQLCAMMFSGFSPREQGLTTGVPETILWLSSRRGNLFIAAWPRGATRTACPRPLRARRKAWGDFVGRKRRTASAPGRVSIATSARASLTDINDCLSLKRRADHAPKRVTTRNDLHDVQEPPSSQSGHVSAVAIRASAAKSRFRSRQRSAVCRGNGHADNGAKVDEE